VNGWLWAAAVLVAALVPLGVVCVRLPAPEGLVALEAAGVDAVLALLLISQGTGRQPFGARAGAAICGNRKSRSPGPLVWRRPWPPPSSSQYQRAKMIMLVR